jgi:phosphatidylserine decarboxylase
MIVRDGVPLIVTGLVLVVLLVWAANRWDSVWPFGLGLVFAVLTVFTAFFFRNPQRTIPSESGVIVAPADGRIVTIEHLDRHPHVGDSAILVSIFLSVFDVHVNRTPASGVINYVDYYPGKFLVAFSRRASDENERTEIGMTTESGRKIAFKQIAGIIARRIVCRLAADDSVSTGERFGMIRFGSRTDIILPPDATVKVQLGQHVKGGSSVIGYLGDRVDSKMESEQKGREHGA